MKALAVYGPWALLFFWALRELLKLNKEMADDSKAREEKLLGCLSGFSSSYEGMSDCVREVKANVDEIRIDVKEIKARAGI